jgi:hypothetical protein
VFTSRPQDVEVYQSGAWWPGSLLGWRHDSAGNCQMWVRVVIGGVEETAWTDLSTLRLPERSSERHLAMAPSLSATEQLKVAAGRMPVPAVVDSSATQSLPSVRERASAPLVPAQRTGGRRRAPEPATAEFAAPGAPSPAAVPVSPAAVPVSPAAVPVSPGRHRAPALAAAGRHRAADTGIWAAVADDATGRLSAPVGGRRAARRIDARRAEPEADLLTRPMRLDDLMPQSRKPRLDGLRGA